MDHQPRPTALPDAPPQGSAMGETGLQKADLRGTNWQGRQFRAVDLRGVKLCRADLRGADLGEARLEGADLTLARYDGFTRWPPGFAYARSGAVGPGARLGGAFLNTADLGAWICRGAFMLEGGFAESRHVFLAGNGLPGRFRAGFRIAELGFGTGLNLLTAYLSWRGTRLSGCLTYIGFEAFPLAYDDMNRALMAFPEVYSTARPLLDAWRAGETRFSAPGLEAEIVLGDARRTLPLWHGGADAWFLDGFAPARNPELWGPELMMEVARHTRAGGTVATYSSAGNVRRALQMAGFEVERTQGYGGKRHMTKGTIGE